MFFKGTEIQCSKFNGKIILIQFIYSIMLEFSQKEMSKVESALPGRSPWLVKTLREMGLTQKCKTCVYSLRNTEI